MEHATIKYHMRFVLSITFLLVVLGAQIICCSYNPPNEPIGIHVDKLRATAHSCSYWIVDIRGDNIIVLKPSLNLSKCNNILILTGKLEEIPSTLNITEEYKNILRDLGLGEIINTTDNEVFQTSKIREEPSEVGIYAYFMAYYENGIVLFVYNDSRIPEDTDDIEHIYNILGIENAVESGYKIVLKFSLISSDYPLEEIEDKIIRNKKLEEMGMFQVSYLYGLPALFIDVNFTQSMNTSIDSIIDIIRREITLEHPIIIILTNRIDEDLQYSILFVDNDETSTNETPTTNPATHSQNQVYNNTSFTNKTGETGNNITVEYITYALTIIILLLIVILIMYKRI